MDHLIPIPRHPFLTSISKQISVLITKWGEYYYDVGRYDLAQAYFAEALRYNRDNAQAQDGRYATVACVRRIFCHDAGLADTDDAHPYPRVVSLRRGYYVIAGDAIILEIMEHSPQGHEQAIAYADRLASDECLRGEYFGCHLVDEEHFNTTVYMFDECLAIRLHDAPLQPDPSDPDMEAMDVVHVFPREPCDTAGNTVGENL